MAQGGNDLTGNYLGGARVAADPSKAQAVLAADFAKFQNVATMRTALAGYGYTTAQLDVMSKLDMTYALRLKTGTI